MTALRHILLELSELRDGLCVGATRVLTRLVLVVSFADCMEVVLAGDAARTAGRRRCFGFLGRNRGCRTARSSSFLLLPHNRIGLTPYGERNVGEVARMGD